MSNKILYFTFMLLMLALTVRLSMLSSRHNQDVVEINQAQQATSEQTMAVPRKDTANLLKQYKEFQRMHDALQRNNSDQG